MKYNVTVIGEASSGKSSLVRGLGGNVQSKREGSRGGMWNTQFKGENETVNHDGNTYDVSEIIGSRGRRSNRRALFDSLQTADIVLYCIPMSEEGSWIFNGPQRTSSHLHSVKNTKAKLIVVGTKMDEATLDFTSRMDEVPFIRNFVFVRASAVTKGGVDELLAALPQVIESETAAFEFSEEAISERKAAQEEAKEAQRKEEEAKTKEALIATLWKTEPTEAAFKKLEGEQVLGGDIAPVA